MNSRPKTQNSAREDGSAASVRVRGQGRDTWTRKEPEVKARVTAFGVLWLETAFLLLIVPLRMVML